MRRAALTAAGFGLAAGVLAPYAVMLLTALKPDAELRTTPPRLLPIAWRPANFLEVLADPGFADWLRVSLVVAAASTAIVVLAAAPAAYYTARHRFPGRTAFLFLVLVTQMFSPTALVVGLYREFFELDLVNTYAALILTNAAFNLAFAIWILRAFFASIPREVEEAAAVDGCGRLSALVRVILPLSRPGLVTAVIFAFIAAWNEYIVALTLMTAPERKPLTVGITSYVTAYVQHWNHLFAASVLAIVPVVVLFAMIERHLVGGLTAGSVK
jgi:multiple sugar transport system permease protein